MTRPFVLSYEHAKHPFRQSLPAHVRAAEPLRAPRSSDHDWKLFLLSFAAFFTAFYRLLF